MPRGVSDQSTSLMSLPFPNCVRLVLTLLPSAFSHCNIRPTAEKPMRNGEVCPKYRTEPFDKPDLSEQVLRLAGVKAY